MTAPSSLPSELVALVHEIQRSSSDLNPCGPSTLHLLPLVFSSLLSSAPSYSTSRTLTSSLLRQADESLLAYPYKEVPTYWRRLYTDAALLRVVGVLGEAEGGTEAAVRDLDMVLIVAGAPGEGRREMVFRLLEIAQARLLASSPTSPSRPAKKPRVASPPPPPLPSPPIHHPLPVLLTPPTLSHFLALLRTTPFILKAGCSTWPASEPERWSSLSYLSALAGPGRVVPVEVGGNYTDESWGQRIVGFDEFLASLSSSSEGEEKLYLAQHDLFAQFPALERDIEVPDYVYSAPEAPENAKEYKAPEGGDGSGVVMNAWLGPAGTVSPAHTDPYFNCYAQVVGSKWIFVAPPEATPHMSTFGSSSTTSSSSESTTTHLMTNTSRIDVTLHLSHPSLSAFPKFEEEVVPVSMQAVLEKGDLLFMPPGWWHSMKALETSFSVSMWF
ncbi:hypothetical protein MNV49_002540 [Pseudohyphozyma bogoriensis]|nr:hypothetical protein MNV49_002540 [Pseudohyphozyma bogoriensis]